jgi:hypothetical protein
VKPLLIVDARLDDEFGLLSTLWIGLSSKNEQNTYMHTTRGGGLTTVTGMLFSCVDT